MTDMTGRWALTSKDGRTTHYGNTLFGVLFNLARREYLGRRYPSAFRDA